MQLLAFVAAAAALTSAVAATPLERREAVSCVPKYSGILRSTYRSDLAAGSNVVPSADSMLPLLTVEADASAGQQFIFDKCSYANGWGAYPEEYGQIRLVSDGNLCVTASGNGVSDGANELKLATCSRDTNEQDFGRQYFYSYYSQNQNFAYVNMELRGGPGGQYDMPQVGTEQKDYGMATTVSRDPTSFKVLALADVKILS